MIQMPLPFCSGTATPAVGNRFSSIMAILSASPVPKHEHTNQGLQKRYSWFISSHSEFLFVSYHRFLKKFVLPSWQLWVQQ